MSYSIVTTKGFIIGSAPYGEAGKILQIFARDIGLVPAIAQGIRLEKSKLRYSAQDCSFGDFSLVKGKEFWRLTDAKCIISLNDSNDLMARIALLLKRLLQGQEAHLELFDCVLECARFISNGPNLQSDDLETLESLVVARMLFRLGYIGNDKDLDTHLKANDISLQELQALKEKRKLLNTHINKALRESHL